MFQNLHFRSSHLCKLNLTMFVYSELFLANSINNYFDCCPKSIRGILSCTKNLMLKGKGLHGYLRLNIILTDQSNSFRIVTLVKSVTLLTICKLEERMSFPFLCLSSLHTPKMFSMNIIESYWPVIIQ